MKVIKVFGLAIGAMCAALALFGPSAAMAESTQLCTNETGICVEPMEIHWVSVGHAVFLTSIVSFECDALMTGTVNLKLVTNGPVTINPATLSYSHCLDGCGASVTREGTLTILNQGNELADVGGSGFKVLGECVGLHCVYNFEKLLGHMLGPLKTGTNHDHVTYSSAELRAVEGFFCPSISKLDLLFQDLSAIWART
jgi:hypothetical protein